MLRVFLAIITIGILASCSDTEPPVVTGSEERGLTLAQRDELADLHALANAVPETLEPFVPTEEWAELHSGVWWRDKVSEAGEVVGHSLHASGADALRWVAEVLWPPRIAEVGQLIKEAEAAGDPTDSLRARLHQFELLQAQLRSTDASQGTSPALQRCTSVANASAGPTTASPGVKAYANARSCTSDSSVATEAEANGYWTANADSKPAGSYASASSAQYGTSGCWSYAGAIAPPNDFDEDSYASCY